MKIIHTADWHIGQHFYGYDRYQEHQHFLQWLDGCIGQYGADVLLVAGDVFDSPNPSAESQRMFFNFLHTLANHYPDLQVIITAGNHDSAARMEAPQQLLEALRVQIRGVVPRSANGEIDFSHLVIPLTQGGKVRAWCLAVPYLRQGDYPSGSDTHHEGVVAMYAAIHQYIASANEENLPVIAMGHLHLSGGELSDGDKSERVVGGLESISPDVFARSFHYTALGHLHKPQQVGGHHNVRYAGSPLPMSFSEKYYKQGVNLICLSETGVQNIQRLEYVPPVSLISIPFRPEPLEQVLQAIEELPDGETDDESPFLEVKVLENEPEPTKKYQIEQAVAGKAVRLVRIKATTAIATPNDEPLQVEQWQRIHPIEVAERAFNRRYGTELPTHLRELLAKVIEEVSV